MGIIGLLYPEDIGFGHGSQHFLDPRNLGQDLRDMVGHLGLPGHISDGDHPLIGRNGQVSLGRPGIQGQFQPGPGCQTIMVHTFQGGRGRAKIREFGQGTEGRTGVGQAHVLQIENQVILSGIIDVLPVNQMDPGFNILVHLLNKFFGPGPVQPHLLHDRLNAIFLVGDQADPKDMGNIGHQKMPSPAVIDQVPLPGLFTNSGGNKG